jgi:hypothetical protein
MSGATPMMIDTVDGVMVEIALTPCTYQVTTLGGVMLCKEDCAQLSMENWTELLDKITTKLLDSKFSEMSRSLTDVEKLDNTVKTEAVLIYWDFYVGGRVVPVGQWRSIAKVVGSTPVCLLFL